MVTRILVLSRAEIESAISTPQLYLGLIGKWNLVSIHGSYNALLNKGMVEELKKIGMDRSISFNFWDITESDVEHLKQQRQNYVLFSQEHARQIISMFQEIKDQEENSVLIIHCHAGISRSGAVGEFATEFFGYDLEEFYLDNPQVSSNKMILRILREESGLGGEKSIMTKEEEEVQKA